MVSAEGSSGSSSPPAAKQYGVTKPLSNSGPTETDLQKTVELEKVYLFIYLFCVSVSCFFEYFLILLHCNGSFWWRPTFMRARKKQ